MTDSRTRSPAITARAARPSAEVGNRGYWRKRHPREIGMRASISRASPYAKNRKRVQIERCPFSFARIRPLGVGLTGPSRCRVVYRLVAFGTLYRLDFFRCIDESGVDLKGFSIEVNRAFLFAEKQCEFGETVPCVG